MRKKKALLYSYLFAAIVWFSVSIYMFIKGTFNDLNLIGIGILNLPVLIDRIRKRETKSIISTVLFLFLILLQLIS